MPILEAEWHGGADVFDHADKNGDGKIEGEDELFALQEEQLGLDSRQPLQIGIDGLSGAQKDALHLGAEEQTPDEAKALLKAAAIDLNIDVSDGITSEELKQALHTESESEAAKLFAEHVQARWLDETAGADEVFGTSTGTSGVDEHAAIGDGHDPIEKTEWHGGDEVFAAADTDNDGTIAGEGELAQLRYKQQMNQMGLDVSKPFPVPGTSEYDALSDDQKDALKTTAKSMFPDTGEEATSGEDKIAKLANVFQPGSGGAGRSAAGTVQLYTDNIFAELRAHDGGNPARFSLSAKDVEELGDGKLPLTVAELPGEHRDSEGTATLYEIFKSQDKDGNGQLDAEEMYWKDGAPPAEAAGSPGPLAVVKEEVEKEPVQVAATAAGAGLAGVAAPRLRAVVAARRKQKRADAESGSEEQEDEKAGGKSQKPKKAPAWGKYDLNNDNSPPRTPIEDTSTTEEIAPPVDEQQTTGMIAAEEQTQQTAAPPTAPAEEVAENAAVNEDEDEAAPRPPEAEATAVAEQEEEQVVVVPEAAPTDAAADERTTGEDEQGDEASSTHHKHKKKKKTDHDHHVKNDERSKKSNSDKNQNKKEGGGTQVSAGGAQTRTNSNVVSPAQKHEHSHSHHTSRHKGSSFLEEEDNEAVGGRSATSISSTSPMAASRSSFASNVVEEQVEVLPGAATPGNENSFSASFLQLGNEPLPGSSRTSASATGRSIPEYDSWIARAPKRPSTTVKSNPEEEEEVPPPGRPQAAASENHEKQAVQQNAQKTNLRGGRYDNSISILELLSSDVTRPVLMLLGMLLVLLCLPKICLLCKKL
ncbi:unnamed protein product [Amoebophrya sp. A120]|nr:unnamed protein product [Amoebophrya sp. A120]|eukprot:GSA120T00000418001.1